MLKRRWLLASLTALCSSCVYAVTNAILTKLLWYAAAKYTSQMTSGTYTSIQLFTYQSAHTNDPDRNASGICHYVAVVACFVRLPHLIRTAMLIFSIMHVPSTECTTDMLCNAHSICCLQHPVPHLSGHFDFAALQHPCCKSLARTIVLFLFLQATRQRLMLF